MRELPFTLRRGHLLVAVAIVLLAFALRVALVFDRAAGDGRFIPPPLSDSDTYFQFARGLLEGTWPNKPYDYQPGAAYVYALLLGATGQVSIPMLRLALSLVDALAAGLLIGAGWLLSGRALGGYLAGLAMALYPVSIYYGTVILLEPLAAFWLCLFLFLALWQRARPALWRSVLAGVVAGWLAATRINLLPVALLWLLYLAVLCPGWRAWGRHAAALLLALVATLAPFTLWNLHAGGRLQLLQSGGWWQLYAGTNRDGDGTGGVSAALAAEAFDGAPDAVYRAALFGDLVIDPGRFAGLLARKFAIFWSEAEPGNNDDFFEVRAFSPLLQSLPAVTFTGLAAAGLVGLLLLFYEDRRLAVWLAALIVLVLAGVLVSFALSRFRYPVVVVLHLLAGYAPVRLWSRWQAGARPGPIRVVLRRYALPGAGIAALLLYPFWALTGDPPPVPPKRTVAALPADARPLNVVFDGVLTLHGWRYAPYRERFPAAAQGWSEPQRPYAVELFWSVQQPVPAAYQFFIAVVADGVRYAGLDRALGTVTYPPQTTDRWQPGVIYAEIVSFGLPPQLPRGRSLPVMAGAYRLEDNRPDGALVPVPITQPPGLASLTLQHLAIYEAGPPPLPDDWPGSELVFGDPAGDQLILRGYALPAAVDAGAVVPLRFLWQAQTDLTRDYNLFIHIMADDGTLAAQGDAAVKDGLLTTTWRPGEPVSSDISVTMPAQPGVYPVFIGLLDSASGERLAVAAPDFRPQIGVIRVR
ncbi:MAG: hypothetical protein MUE40_16030 [Anaerolineae bacterium]|nr:hypothetical protein [Anaerolineae bacterium]